MCYEKPILGNKVDFDENPKYLFVPEFLTESYLR